MLKIATLDDIPAIVPMARKFHQTSPYKDFDFDVGKVIKLIEHLIGDRQRSCVILGLNEQGKPVGVIGATVTDSYMGNDRFATEIMWWVDPEYRKSKTALKLVQAYEYWAKKLKCRTVNMMLLYTDQLEQIEKFYLRRGYQPAERAYFKEL